ncbi:ThiF family adenylyltransferase [Chloroflexales bacterium ZM16-3]|nr:ThiF family adenylyltransferase [Chloroflexales bacterium ZM16-3]
MLVTLPAELIDQAIESALPGGTIYGRLCDDGDLAQVHGLSPDAGAAIGHWSRDGEQAPERGLWLVFAVTGDPQAYLLGSDDVHSLECRVIRAREDYLARARGILPDGALAGRCVTVIGLGSGGSLIATQLARCGVGHMRLVDFDRLEAHNIARHACPLADIGRYKTRALRDLLLAHSPLIRVETWEANVLEQPTALAQALSSADLVVAAVDGEAAKLAINRACWAAGIPTVYAAAYNRAFGGDVFCALPPDGACYNCLSSVIGELFAPPPTAASDFSAGYADPSRMADMVAQPGLAMDVGVIALLAARVALETLLRGHDGVPEPLPDAWLLFGNRAEWVFREPLDHHFVAVPRRDDCPVCNYAQSVQSRLGISPAEAVSRRDSILAEIDSEDAEA